MAELVEFNLEKSVKFFNELKNYIDENQIKDFVRKRKNFEYKIASQKKEYKSFESYIKHELKVLKTLRDLKIPDGGTSLITDQKNLIERLIRQMTTHFQYLPKVFLYAIHTMKQIRRKTSERHYWEELLKKHGSKNVDYYICAGIDAIKERNEIVYKRNQCHVESELKLVAKKLETLKETNSVKKISKLEKEKELLMCEKNKLKHISFIDHMNWTRDNLMNAFIEFPKNKFFLMNYLKFEIVFRDHFIHYTEELEEQSLAVKNGLMIDLILNRIIKDFNDVAYLKEIREIMGRYAKNFESDALDKIIEIVKNAPFVEEVTISKPEEPMEVEDSDKFENFREQYPDLKVIRAKNPIVFGGEFHDYLQKLKEKLINEELKKSEELPKIRSALEWILNCAEWSSNSLDIWWDYYEIEKYCGDEMKSFMILQNADKKLKFDLKNKLNLRRLVNKSM